MIRNFVSLILVLAFFGSTLAVAEQKAGPTCELCTVALTYAQQYLEQNATEQEVLNLINNDLCAKLGSLSAVCTQYVNAYGKVILYELAQKLDPSVVCSHLGLCSSTSVNVNINPKMKVNSVGDNCPECVLVFTELITVLSNPATEKEALAFIDNEICAKLGPLAQQCKSVVDSLGPSVLTKLISLLNPQKLCQLIKLCPTFFQAKLNLKDNCASCELVFQELITALSDPSIEKEALDFIDNEICSKLGQYSAQCKSLVDSLGPSVLAKLLSLINPKQVCQLIKLCPASSSSSAVFFMLNRSNPVDCELCKTFVKTIEDQLESAANQAQIKAALLLACNSLSGSLESVCQLAVNNYLKPIIDYFVQWVNNENICKGLKYCDN